jgi:hypothetical protein
VAIETTSGSLVEAAQGSRPRSVAACRAASLREAVKALSLANVLDVRRGDGTYATSLEPGVLLKALSFIVDYHHGASVLEFLRVRRILEPAVRGNRRRADQGRGS